jgi:hypothetical protein
MVDFNDLAQIAHEASKDCAKVKTSTPVTTTTPTSTSTSTSTSTTTSADGAQAGPPKDPKSVGKEEVEVAKRVYSAKCPPKRANFR